MLMRRSTILLKIRTRSPPRRSRKRQSAISPNRASSNAAAILAGWRIAASPPASGIYWKCEMRRKSEKSATIASPPQIAPSSP